MSDDDRDLANQAKEGHADAFDRLVERHGPVLLAYLRRRLGSGDDAMDTFQETFLSAHRSLHQLQNPEHFRAWLFQIAIHQSRQRAKLQRRRETTSIESVEEPGDDHPDPIATLCTREEMSEVRGAVDALPERQRDVLSLRIDGRLSFSEIASLLGIREDNARAHHYHALRSLRRRLVASVAPSSPEGNVT